jgi:hypothetical protein
VQHSPITWEKHYKSCKFSIAGLPLNDSLCFSGKALVILPLEFLTLSMYQLVYASIVNACD